VDNIADMRKMEYIGCNDSTNSTFTLILVIFIETVLIKMMNRETNTLAVVVQFSVFYGVVT
jgi:hypothetical protein